MHSDTTIYIKSAKQFSCDYRGIVARGASKFVQLHRAVSSYCGELDRRKLNGPGTYKTGELYRTGG